MQALSTKYYFLFSIIFLMLTSKAIDQEELDSPEDTNALLEKYLNQALKYQYSGKLKEEVITSIEATLEAFKNPTLPKEEKWRLNIMLTALLSTKGYSPFFPESFYYRNFRDYQLEERNFITASVRGFIATILCSNSLSLIEGTINSLLPTEETATALAFSVPLIMGFLVFLGSPPQDNNKLLQTTFPNLYLALSCLKTPLSTEAQEACDNNTAIKVLSFSREIFHPEARGAYLLPVKPHLFKSSDIILAELISYLKQKHFFAPPNQTLRAIYVCMELILEKTTNTNLLIKRAISSEQQE